MNGNPVPDSSRELARMMYTRHHNTIAEVSLKTGATQAEVRSWIQQGKWDHLRHSYMTTRETQLELLYEILSAHISKIMAQNESDNSREDNTDTKSKPEGNTKDADLLIKYTAAIRNLEKENSVSEIIDVAKIFCRWLAKKDLELAKTVTAQFDDFISERLDDE